MREDYHVRTNNCRHHCLQTMQILTDAADEGLIEGTFHTDSAVSFVDDVMRLDASWWKAAGATAVTVGLGVVALGLGIVRAGVGAMKAPLKR